MRRIFNFLLLVSLSAVGQHSISGKIFSSDKQLIKNASIHVDGQTTLSGTDGVFSFPNVPKGKYSLRVEYFGHDPFDSIISVDQDIQLRIRLIQKKEMLEQVTVTKPASLEKLQTYKLRQDEIKRNLSQSLADLLSGIPGVTALRTGSTISKPMIHGLHSSRVPIIVNGFRLEDQGWGIEHAPAFSIGQAEKISVIKGVGVLQYGGDAIGGLVLIEPKERNIDSLSGSVATGFQTNGRGGVLHAAVTRSNILGWNWRIKSDAKYFGDHEAPDYVLSNSGSREFSCTVDLLHKGAHWKWGTSASIFKTNLGILLGAHIGNAADLYYAINNQKPYIISDFTYTISNPRQEVLHLAGQVFAALERSAQQYLKIQYQIQHNKRYEFDLRRGANRNRPALDLALTTHSMLFDGFTKTEGLKVSYGTTATYQHNFADPDTGIRPLIPIYDKIDAGGYAITQQDLTAALLLEAGIRYDFSHITADKFYLKSRWDERGYNPQFNQFIIADANTQWRTKPRFNYHNLSASIGLRYQPKDNINMLFSLIRRVRNPNPSELFSDGLHHSNGMIELGTLSLKQEKATKLLIDFNFRTEKWDISVGPFANSISDFMYLYPIGFETTIRGVFPVWEFRQTDALLAGLDLFSEWNFDQHWRYSVQASYLYGWNATDKEFLIDIPPPNLTQKIIFSLPAWRRFKMEISQHLVAIQTHYPNANFNTNIMVDGVMTPVNVDISTPPPGYGLWSFYSEITFEGAYRSFFTFGLGIQNLTNKSYRNYMNRQRFFADEVGRNFMFQISYNF